MTVSALTSGPGRANRSLPVPVLPLPAPPLPPDAIGVGVFSFLLLVFLPFCVLSSGSMYQ